ncbi:hypothetical protein F4554_005481 [Actinopolymorpha rutila]|uniref:Uncharacterized protein n=1 Tax=Actinopolymorpha rutila TaxID=446787 RepID=A0A852ZKV8_9ACTN|nr:hypothetical protein [Actinopolymorpha rutila]
MGAGGTYLVSNSRWHNWIGAHDDTDGPWSQAFGSISGLVGVIIGLAVLLAAAILWTITLTVK